VTEYLVDTNVISETARPKPDPAVLSWLGDQAQVWLSVVSLYEIARGIKRARAGRRREFLEEWFQKVQGGAFQPLPFDESAAHIAADIEAEGRHKGRNIEVRDLFLLASARSRRLAIATRNVAHFRGFGVTVHDPFSDGSTKA
jgi:toxin FitB